MGTKINPGTFDCYANAAPDEPMFVLLARDPWAPDLIDIWAGNRLSEIERGIRPESDLAKVEEALACADAMREWRKVNRPGTSR